MFTFLLLFAGLCWFIWWVVQEPKGPNFLNVLTETEAEAKRVADEAAKAKSWLARFKARVSSWLNASAKTDQEG